jgi:hypothetical protein
MGKRSGSAVLAALSLSAALIAAPVDTSADRDVLARIRTEASAHSGIMRTLHMLTDLYGPRLTGSPNAKAAAEWSLKTMTSWGLVNAHLEPWDFGHPGWVNERAAAYITAPIKDQLSIEVLAWTPGTNGTVSAPAVELQIPERPTVNELTTYLESVRSEVKGRIVLAGRPRQVPVNLTPRPARRDDSELQRRYDPEASAEAERRPGAPRQPPPPMSARDVDNRIDQFLHDYGALVRINDAGREMGQIAAFHNPSYDPTRVVPTVVMRNEDYGRIARILADRTPVQLEVAIANRLSPDGRTSYNAVAEIAGTDRSSEVVMLGAHLDSWHAATGATDNAIGCAVMMEAARILRAIGARPRRTIRVALWTGEEQGLLGSQAYVREHFGPFESPKPAYGSLSAYLNLDNGTGRVRGASVFGPPAAAAVIRAVLAPFADLGVVGAAVRTQRTLGSTDSTSFNAAGLPGINFEQDPIQYESFTHHTNLDTYERVIEDDVKASAMVIAGTAYQLAMRDDLVPRFDKATMPAGSWR